MRDPIIYVPGIPGSEAELRLAGPPRRVRALPLGADALPVPRARLVAFSLGTFRALTWAAEQPAAVHDLVLISPAAPLELGDFLPDMAGQAIFRLAKHPVPFWALTLSQALSAWMSPARLRHRIFTTETASERAILDTPDRRAILEAGLRQTFGPERAAYRRLLQAYVRPWANLLDRIQCPVHIIHGGADCWTPTAMAAALSRALPAEPTVTRLQEAGHYGTLIRVLEGEVQNVWS